MSILLEALRKSEKNQHLRETPTIHTDNQPGPVSEPLPTRWLILLLVVALLVTGWFVWRQYQQPAGSIQPPVKPVVAQAPAVSGSAAVDKKAVEAVSSPPSTLPSTTPATKPSTRASTGQNRTPVESYQPPSSNNTSPEPGGRAVDTGNSKLEPDSSTATGPTGSKQTAGAALKEPGSRAVVDEPVDTVREGFHPDEPAPISYWELPDSVRSDIPEIKFSVLVYALKPANRFVLINGQRLEEGDTAQPGLVVKEIRRDGVVFTYRLYNFLVER